LRTQISHQIIRGKTATHLLVNNFVDNILGWAHIISVCRQSTATRYAHTKTTGGLK
jgi:hypothetical protein